MLALSVNLKNMQVSFVKENNPEPYRTTGKNWKLEKMLIILRTYSKKFSCHVGFSLSVFFFFFFLPYLVGDTSSYNS